MTDEQMARVLREDVIALSLSMPMPMPIQSSRCR
ncbi:hypothetical protein RLDS_25715 [Sphingobium lactosutens DS20]|jgi:hypothetical protein|uniref:Uncharacterized protein n=1 Tax=Sphingobium lactosutens DS20 TaxID=1331060 RepID=T0HD11_9SPHN|nr:hypothetical protein RLDS_25715 [Sphingobium lactosutens DS20]